jgi:hypothetical protein
MFVDGHNSSATMPSAGKVRFKEGRLMSITMQISMKSISDTSVLASMARLDS